MDERRYRRRHRETEEKERKTKPVVDREERRKRIARRRKFRNMVSLLFILILLGAGILLFIRTPLFNIEIIEIKGNARVSSETIMKTGALSVGENIFDCNKEAVKERIIKLPYISEVSVVKKFPSKIIIRVKEDDEFAALMFDDVIISCDRNGKSIRGITAERANELICLNDIVQGEFALGEYVALDSKEHTELLKKCLRIVDVYEFTDVNEIKMHDKYNVVFVLDGNRTLMLGELGNDDEIAYKISCVKEVLEDPDNRENRTIDARNPEVGIFSGYGTHDTVINTEEEGNDSEGFQEIDDGIEASEETTEEISE